MLAALALLGVALAAGAQGAVLVPANDPHLQYSGRFDFSDPLAPRFDWPALSIQAVLSGTASVGILLNDSGANYYDVFIDGALQTTLGTQAAAASLTYTTTGLSPGSHTLLLVKRTEASFGIGTFGGLLLDDGASTLPPPPPPGRRVEFVGDSLACGAEDEDPATACDAAHFGPTENAWLAYGPVAARSLCADYHVTAISGIGLVHNAGDINVVSAQPMPYYYPRVLQNQATPAWDAAAWVPDAIVVFVGGNDYNSPPSPTQAQFEAAYLQFISTLQAGAPGAHIFCVSFYGENMASYVNDVVLQEQAAGQSVSTILLDYPSTELTGCYSHPTVAGQQAIAVELAAALQGGMAWAPCGPSPTVTPTFSASPSASPSFTVSPSFSASPTISPSGTVTMTPTPVISGPLVVDRVAPVPQPNPRRIYVLLERPADDVEFKLYSQAYNAVRPLQHSGPMPKGWTSIAVPRLFQGLPPGVYYLVLRAAAGGQKSPAVRAKILLL